MKDSELQFDRTCHVAYSKPCKKQMQAKIALHYPETGMNMEKSIPNMRMMWD